VWTAKSRPKIEPRAGSSLDTKQENPTFVGFPVEAPGIENDKRPTVGTIEQRNGSIGVRAVSANVPDRASRCAIDRREVAKSSEPYELSNVVETALEKALVFAAAASQ